MWKQQKPCWARFKALLEHQSTDRHLLRPVDKRNMQSLQVLHSPFLGRNLLGRLVTSCETNTDSQLSQSLSCQSFHMPVTGNAGVSAASQHKLPDSRPTPSNPCIKILLATHHSIEEVCDPSQRHLDWAHGQSTTCSSQMMSDSLPRSSENAHGGSPKLALYNGP